MRSGRYDALPTLVERLKLIWLTPAGGDSQHDRG